MEKQKDCKIIFLNKEVYEFSFEDIGKALMWAKENNNNVWAIETPAGILQPMDEETFENVMSFTFDGPADEPTPEDLI